MNPLLKGVQANDAEAKDLVTFIIKTLHDELNEKQNQNNTNNNIQGNQNNKKLMLKNFMDAFRNENYSILMNLFYGVDYYMDKCSNCLLCKYNFHVDFFLYFPLEEIRKYKLEELQKQNMMMEPMNMMIKSFGQNKMNSIQMNQQEFQNNLIKINLLKNNSVDIFDCFDYDQRMVNFTGENIIYCDTCKNSFPTEYQSKIYYGPKILILALNRGWGKKYKVKLQFSLELDLTNYIENKTSGCIYDLIGVVTHMGEGGSGHFIASCKSPVDNNWYQYNDDLVYPINNFKEEILDVAMPYILFYKKKK